MTPSDILAELTEPKERLPAEALRAALEHWEAVRPALIESLEDVMRRPDYYLEHDEFTLHIYALFLLAQQRERGAFEVVARFFSLPDEAADFLTGEVLSSDGDRILASLGGGEIARLQALVENEALEARVRFSALNALVLLVAWGELPRETVVEYFRALLHGRLARPGNGKVWSEFAFAIHDLNARELIPELMRAFDEGVIPEDGEIRDLITEWFEEPERDPLQEWTAQRLPITDVVEEFTPEEFDDEEDEDAEAEDEDRDASLLNNPYAGLSGLPPATAAETGHIIASGERYVAPAKVGRNDPCPCGSGKKFKKCCGK